MLKFRHKLCKGLDAIVRQLVMNPLPPGLFEFWSEMQNRVVKGKGWLYEASFVFDKCSS